MRAPEHPVRRSTDIACLLAVAVITLGTCLVLLTRYPAPGGDEPSFVGPAITFMTQFRLASEIHEGLLRGIERHVFWQPPLYFMALGVWFRVFGIGLVQARLFSVVGAVAITASVYLLSRHWTSPKHAFAASALCAVSYWLTIRARYARMDTLCVALILISLSMYLRGTVTGHRRWYSSSGVFAGLAFLTHPLGMIAIAAIVGDVVISPVPRASRSAKLWAVACFAITACLWLGYIVQDVDAFREQMRAQFLRKYRLTPSYWYQFATARARAHVVSLALVLFASLRVIVRAVRDTSLRMLAAVVSIAVGAATYGREVGYFIYFYPLACVALAVLLQDTRRMRRVVYALVAVAFANELLIGGFDVWRYHGRNYQAVTDALRATIPPGRSVFVGFSGLSPYFALLGRNPMRVAVPVPVSDPSAYAKLLSQSDFIVDTVPVPGFAGKDDQLVLQIDQGEGYRIAVYRRRSPAVAGIGR